MAAEVVRPGRPARRERAAGGVRASVHSGAETTMISTIRIEGEVAPGFGPVRDAFAANFERVGDYQELGAALCAFHDGRCVVDIWGGWADRAKTRRWERDTLVNVWSATKGLTATAVARLVDQGRLDYEAAAARYWPGFASACKDR